MRFILPQIRRDGRRAAALIALLAIALMGTPANAQTHDPTLRWQTLRTSHFDIYFYQGERPIADRIAAIGEGIFGAVGDLMAWHPHARVHILVSDNTDDGNGFASVVPYNTIRLWAAAPEDLSELGEYDDYLQQLLTHEFTHIVHMDNVTGVPTLINLILGKVFPPNGIQPSWLVEGIAVYSETRNTSGGRLRGSAWDMFMRADALADHFVGLDQLSSGPPPRWPHGQIAYLYGSHFVEYIVRRFGEHVLRDIAAYTGRQLIPLGMNRSVRRATGYTYEELYPQFLEDLRQHYRAQRDAIVAMGLREGERITFQGENIAYPRFMPDGHTVVFQSGDGVTHAQLRAIDVGTVNGPIAHARDGAWIEAMSGFALDHDARRMVLSDVGFHREIYFYRDLYLRDVEQRDDGSLHTSANHAISDGLRAQYPDISPDDDHVAFTVNHRSTTTLFESSLTEQNPQPLFQVQRYDQVYTPRYSPDGREIAFSHWQSGGFRDIRIYDRATHAIRDVTHDRSLDMHPVYSPDGRYLVWSSDRTGVFNLYALDRQTGVTRQATNVVHGAFMPAISPDGRTLVYVGYGTMGYDLYRMAFDPATWTDMPPEREHEGARIPTPPIATHPHAYNPFPTLRPHYYYFELADDGFGPQVAVLTQGSDIVGNHQYFARFGIGLVRGDPAFDITYYYSGLRPTFRMHLYRAVTASHWHIGATDVVFPYDHWGGETEVAVNFPALFASNSVSLSYEAQYLKVIGPVAFNRFADPNEPATLPPFEGWLAGLRATWAYSHVHRYSYSLTSQEGFDAVVSIHGTDRVLGSELGSFDATAACTVYVPMPWSFWRQRHIVALRAAGGISTSDSGPRGIFSLGGFPTYDASQFISTLISLSVAGGVALRGYAPFARTGSAYYLLNLEYRMPIWHIEHGASTLPLYLSQVYGAAILDVGNAFYGRFRPEDVAVGVGTELFLDFVVGWYFTYSLRLGLARGVTGPDGQWQGYALLSAPF